MAGGMVAQGEPLAVVVGPEATAEMGAMEMLAEMAQEPTVMAGAVVVVAATATAVVVVA